MSKLPRDSTWQLNFYQGPIVSVDATSKVTFTTPHEIDLTKGPYVEQDYGNNGLHIMFGPAQRDCFTCLEGIWKHVKAKYPAISGLRIDRDLIDGKFYLATEDGGCGVWRGKFLLEQISI
jgi:hypothetical protein